MKRYCLLLIGLCLFTVQLDAQVAFASARELTMISRGVAKSVRKGNPLYIPGKARVGRTGLYSFQVTHVLRRRAFKTMRKAYKTQRALASHPRSILLDPVVYMGPANKPVLPLVKSVPYLRTPKQIRLYLTAQENRLYTREITHLYENILPQLKENLPRIREEAQTRMPANVPAFLAKAIPPEVNTVAIGEVHRFDAIKQFVAKIIPALRKARPNQEIILFTEFASNSAEHSAEGLAIMDAERMSIWDAANKNNIRVVGLEPEEVLQDYSFSNVRRGNDTYFIEKTPEKLQRNTFFASANGLKWRNEIFTKIIQEYRAKYPDALFVIYAGDAHVNPLFPFAITTPLKPEETFIISLFPARSQVKSKHPEHAEKDIRFLWDPIGDMISDTETFDRPFLYIKDPQLARIAGSNVYIQVDENLVAPKWKRNW